MVKRFEAGESPLSRLVPNLTFLWSSTHKYYICSNERHFWNLGPHSGYLSG
eukprot:SAG11_NODE_3067_length_2715_cov_1.530581_1_plen_51_part_00